MKANSRRRESRRDFSRRDYLMLAGGSMLSLPILGLFGCTPEEAEPPPTSDNNPTGKDPKPATAPPSGSAPAAAAAEPSPDTAEMPKLDENSQMAQALGYTANANTVDEEEFPSRSANAFCKNCANFQAPAESKWGPCTIFPGQLVNADGWCSVYVAKS